MKKYIQLARLFLWTGVSALLSSSLCAIPANPTIEQGTFSTSITGKTTRITASDGAIIQWDDFFIEPDEEIIITLPNSSSKIFNRLPRHTLSTIMGRISCNGDLVLISEAGMHFHNQAIVTCQGLTAIAQPLTNEQLLSGEPYAIDTLHQSLWNSSGKFICNQDVTIVAPTFFNSGTITAPGSKITIISKRLFLNNRSVIDSSGQEGGGTILLGGGWHGNDPSIPNADIVRVDPGVTIIADAISSGSGGDVVVWADEKNSFAGTISSKGKDGHGGNVEISAKGLLQFTGTTILTADSGNSGTLLLDPTNILVRSSNPDIEGNGSHLDITSANELSDPNVFPGVTSIITGSALNTLLSSNSVILAAYNTITIDTPVTIGASETLTLNAPTINLNQPITLFDTTATLNGSASTANIGANGKIQNGVTAVQSGGIVNLSEAIYDESIEITKPLSLKGKGSNLSIIQPSSISITGAVIHLFEIPTAGKVEISNLGIKNKSPTLFECGISGQNCLLTDFIIDNVTIDNPSGTSPIGYSLFFEPGSIDIHDCHLSAHYGMGIYIISPLKNVRIVANTILGNPPNGDSFANNGIYVATSFTTESILIDSNIIQSFFYGLYLPNSYNSPTTISRNKIRSVDYYALVLDGGHFTISDNLLEGDRGGAILYYSSASFHRNTILCNQTEIGMSFVNCPCTLDHDRFIGTPKSYFIDNSNNTYDIWPSTASVSFNGFVPTNMTIPEFRLLLPLIADRHNFPNSGLVLDYLSPSLPPQPPKCFVGTIKRNHHRCHKKPFLLKMRWKNSLSSNISYYRIFANGKLIKEIPSSQPFFFKVPRHTKQVRKHYKISAVSTTGLESNRIKLYIKGQTKSEK